MSNSYFELMEDKETVFDRMELPLTDDGLSHRLKTRLARARHNGGHERSIMKNHAPRNPEPKKEKKKSNPLKKETK